MPTKSSTGCVGGWIVAGLAIVVLAPARLCGDEPGKIVGWIDNNDPNRTIHRGPEPSDNNHRGDGQTPRPQPAPQPNPPPNPQRQVDQEEQRRKEAAEENRAGQEALDSEDWGTAIDKFESALELNPDNQLYQQNLQYARQKLAEAQADARRKEQASLENHEGVEAFAKRDWTTALRYFQQASDRWPDNPVYVKNLYNAQRQVDRVQRDASAANDMAVLIGQMVDTLPSLSGGGPDFDRGSATPGLNNPALNISDADGLRDAGNESAKGESNGSSLKISDADNVVDARNVPSGLPKSVDDAIPHGPVGDRVRKGFECVMEHDWPAAKAWFEDALNKDPGDAGVARLIDLAKWTMQREKATALTFEDADAVMSQMFREGAPIGKTVSADPELDQIMDEMFRKMLTEDPRIAAVLAKPTGAAAAVEDPAWQKILELLGSGAMGNPKNNEAGKGAGN